jgi:hypothetical protein
VSEHVLPGRHHEMMDDDKLALIGAELRRKVGGGSP